MIRVSQWLRISKAKRQDPLPNGQGSDCRCARLDTTNRTLTVRGGPAVISGDVKGKQRRKPAGDCHAVSYPAFSSSAMLIFCAVTISLVTTNSRTFLYEGT